MGLQEEWVYVNMNVDDIPMKILAFGRVFLWSYVAFMAIIIIDGNILKINRLT